MKNSIITLRNVCLNEDGVMVVFGGLVLDHDKPAKVIKIINFLVPVPSLPKSLVDSEGMPIEEITNIDVAAAGFGLKTETMSHYFQYRYNEKQEIQAGIDFRKIVTPKSFTRFVVNYCEGMSVLCV